MDLLEEEKPVSIKLADGKEYEFPVMSLNVLANAQTTMGFKFAQLIPKLSEDPIVNTRLALYALLKEKYPDITLEKVGNLITISNMKELSKVLASLTMV